MPSKSTHELTRFRLAAPEGFSVDSPHLARTSCQALWAAPPLTRFHHSLYDKVWHRMRFLSNLDSAPTLSQGSNTVLFHLPCGVAHFVQTGINAQVLLHAQPIIEPWGLGEQFHCAADVVSSFPYAIAIRDSCATGGSDKAAQRTRRSGFPAPFGLRKPNISPEKACQFRSSNPSNFRVRCSVWLMVCSLYLFPHSINCYIKGICCSHLYIVMPRAVNTSRMSWSCGPGRVTSVLVKRSAVNSASSPCWNLSVWRSPSLRY